jgi:hypothetical protein
MKQNRHIALFVVMISFFTMLVSCGPSAEEKQKSEQEIVSTPPSMDEVVKETPARETLEQTFEADTLTAGQLTAFQQRGAEKLADFINYMELISNKTYDGRLRLELGKQAEALFADPTAWIAISINDKKEKKQLTAFLDDFYKNEYDSIKVKTDSVVMQQPERADKGGIYKGTVSEKVSVMGYKNKKIVFSSTGLREATTLILKMEKNFGGDKKMVWEVMLGEIK